MENQEFPTITLSNVKYNSFKKYNFKFVKGQYPIQNGYELTDYNDVYYPFEIPNLYEKFASIDSSNTDEVLSFINEYGNIGVINEDADPYFERWIYWKDEIKNMKQAIILSELYSYENIKYKIKQLDSEFNLLENTTLYRFLTLDNGSLNTNFLEKSNEFDLRMACLLDLQNILESNIGNVSFIPFIDLDSNEKPCFKAKMNFPSLLSMMYWQLYMKFYENNRYFICEGCNETLPWFNHKKNYLCSECYDRHNYKKQMNDIKTKAHRSFMNKSGHYALDNNSSYIFFKKESKKALYKLREEIKDMSLENKNFMNEEDYLKWLKDKEDMFMNEVKKYIEED